MPAMTRIGELAAALGRIDFDAVQRAALTHAAERIAELVREKLSGAPGDAHDAPWLESGALRDSIAQDSDAERAVVGSTSEVAVDQELGTAHVPPRPFLAPVAAANSAELAEAIGAAFAAALRDVR